MIPAGTASSSPALASGVTSGSTGGGVSVAGVVAVAGGGGVALAGMGVSVGGSLEP